MIALPSPPSVTNFLYAKTSTMRILNPCGASTGLRSCELFGPGRGDTMDTAGLVSCSAASPFVVSSILRKVKLSRVGRLTLF